MTRFTQFASPVVHNVNANVHINEQFLSLRESCNIVTTAATLVLSSAVYRNERVSATVTSEMTEVSSNTVCELAH